MSTKQKAKIFTVHYLVTGVTDAFVELLNVAIEQKVDQAGITEVLDWAYGDIRKVDIDMENYDMAHGYFAEKYIPGYQCPWHENGFNWEDYESPHLAKKEPAKQPSPTVPKKRRKKA